MTLGTLPYNDGIVIQYPNVPVTALGAPGEKIFSVDINLDNGGTVSETSRWFVIQVD